MNCSMIWKMSGKGGLIVNFRTFLKQTSIFSTTSTSISACIKIIDYERQASAKGVLDCDVSGKFGHSRLANFPFRAWVLLFECENVFLDAMTHQEGTGYIESCHEPGDIPRLMARARSRFLDRYFVNHLLAVENSENRG